MTAIRIVCAPDAEETADMLARLLSAELYDVRLSHGRQSLEELPAARTAQEIVLVIWSRHARAAQFVRDWCAATDPSRLVEIARAPTWPRSKTRAPAIDFTTWRGERGGRAWGALKDRLRHIASQWEPPKPPPYRRMAAAGVATVCAVTGALTLAGGQRAPEPAAGPAYDDFALIETGPAYGGGVGGATRLLEPPSADELERPLPMPARLRASAAPLLARYESASLEVVEAELPPPSFFDRLRALNPLLRDARD